MNTATKQSSIHVCLALTNAISHTTKVAEIYEPALDALRDGLGVDRAALLLFDEDGMMRFKAWRGLSDTYRHGVEGHTPWMPETCDAAPIVINDVANDAGLRRYLNIIQAEGIAAMTFVPLVSQNRVIGKFMLYSAEPRELSEPELTLASVIAALVAFAVQRTIAEEAARRSEERLRFALEAASMGTWEWDLVSNRVQWSDNLERVHGLPPGIFDGTFASYEREIHPDDHDRVIESTRRAIETGALHDIEYRIIAPDGSVRWVEGKGRVEYVEGRPVRMTGVCVNVTRRKQAEIDQLRAAEDTNRLKDEFLAVLSHELRTPLNAIVGWVHMMQNGGMAPERTAKALDVIARNARLQSQLIEDMLDVSRIVANQLHIERMPLFIGSVLDQALAAVRPAARANHVKLLASTPPDLPPVEGDPRRLLQVLTNLLSNAVKFTPENGRVTVKCASDGQSVVIEIRDSGIGIDPAFLPHVFERFRQADSTTRRQQGGLGLGLAIAHHLVQQHGGRLRAASDGSGRGSTFTLELPALRGDAQAAESPAARLTAETSTANLAGARVLVVDDDEDARQMLKAALEAHGADVDEAANGYEALSKAHARKFELVLADIAMPGMDGYDLIAMMKRLQPQTAAVAVSACARPIDRERALAAGYAAVETNPVDLARLLSTAATCIERGRTRPRPLRLP